MSTTTELVPSAVSMRDIEGWHTHTFYALCMHGHAILYRIATRTESVQLWSIAVTYAMGHSSCQHTLKLPGHIYWINLYPSLSQFNSKIYHPSKTCHIHRFMQGTYIIRLKFENHILLGLHWQCTVPQQNDCFYVKSNTANQTYCVHSYRSRKFRSSQLSSFWSKRVHNCTSWWRKFVWLGTHVVLHAYTMYIDNKIKDIIPASNYTWVYII